MLRLNIITIFLLLFTQLYAQLGENQTTVETEIDPCDLEKAKAILAAQIDDMNVEQIEEIIRNDLQQKQDEQKAQLLAQLLVKAQEIGQIPITDCSELKVLGESEDAQAMRAELAEFCQSAPNGFFAQLESDGSIKFTIQGGDNGGNKSLTLGGGGNFALSYRKHELKFNGNISNAAVNSVQTETETDTFHYDAKVDYSIDTGIRNLESFLRWDTDYESISSTTQGNRSSSILQKHTIAAGARLELFQDNDKFNLEVGAGGGAAYKRTGGTLSLEQMGIWTPTVVGTVDVKVIPNDYVSLYTSSRIQRDFHPENPALVASQAIGVDVKAGPMTIGVKGEASYDTNRELAGLKPTGYTGMFTVGVNFGDLFSKNKKKREAARKAHAREQAIWSRAASYAEEL